jgi:DNA-binding XRE family transcriptional regulator
MAKKKVIPGYEKICSAVPVNDHLKSLLKDPAFKKHCLEHWEKLGLAKPVIDYRIRHKLSQAQLAQKSGVTEQQLYEIENAAFRSKANLLKVIRFINLRRRK